MLDSFTGTIIHIDEQGCGQLYGKALNTTSALKKLITYTQDLCAKRNMNIKTYGIVHAGVPNEAQAFAEQTKQALKRPPEFILPVATTIGLHAGFGSVALAFMME